MSTLSVNSKSGACGATPNSAIAWSWQRSTDSSPLMVCRSARPGSTVACSWVFGAERAPSDTSCGTLAPMKVALLTSFDAQERAEWQSALAAACPGVQWLANLETGIANAELGDIAAAVVANPAPGALNALARLPGLRLIQSLWAGVERLLADPALPAGVPVARMVDPAMTAAMAETALWATLALHRGFFAYARRQRRALWRQHRQRRADELQVLVLGLGAMGAAVAARLAAQGYRVSGWRASTDAAAGQSAPAGIDVLSGMPALWQRLPSTQILINLLPLTAATTGLIDNRLLAALPRGAAVINLARGAHIVDEDLVAALDSGHLRHAVLDVFACEPLPATHPYWSHDAVTVLPHAAALTDPRSAAAVVAENLRRLACSEPLLHLVDRRRGY